ncbi:MAG: DUF5317 domain-containing protein [Chloroflexota bacterium]
MACLEGAAGNPPQPGMVLLWAVALGLAAGLARAWLTRQPFRQETPDHIWLLLAAASLQAIAFYIPATRTAMPKWLAALALVGSQAGLLVFVYLNRRQAGFPVLGAGLALNILVIVANCGWMPTSPQVLAELFPGYPSAALQPGMRVGWSKDVLLLPAETRLAWLSDCMLLPAWFPQRAAFSFGDVWIATGAFWALWARGGPQGWGIPKLTTQEKT